MGTHFVNLYQKLRRFHLTVVSWIASCLIKDVRIIEVYEHLSCTIVEPLHNHGVAPEKWASEYLEDAEHLEHVTV